MPNKSRERFYLKQLRACSIGLPEGEASESESPDFLIDANPSLGVEFTEFHLPAAPGERPHQELQSLQKRVITLANKRHAAAGGPGLYVHAMFGRHGRLDKRTVQAIGDALADVILSYPVPRSKREPRVEIPRHLLPTEIAHVSVQASVDGVDRLWQGGNASWVAPVTATHIETELDRKRPMATVARRKCERLWLIIVQDIGTEAHACELTEPGRLARYHHPFDRLLWLDPHAPLAVDLGA
jgi:hypothetical protein